MGVEPGGLIVGDARRQNFGFPGARRRLETLERIEREGKRVRAFETRVLGDVLPSEKEAQEVARRDGFDLGAQAPDRIMMDAGEQAPVAPLLVVDAGLEAAAQDRPLGFESEQGGADRGRLQPERGGERGPGRRPEAFEASAQDFDQRKVALPYRVRMVRRRGDRRRERRLRP